MGTKETRNAMALEITAKLVSAALSANNSNEISALSGKEVAEYFNKLYFGIKDITDNLTL